MNNVNLMGRLCCDIELKNTHNGSVCTKFSLAVDRYANGNKTVDFIRCIAWGKNAENIGRVFRKGDMLAVQGNIKTGSFNDRNGNKHYTTDIYVTNFYFTGNKAKHQNGNTQNNGYQNGNSASYGRNQYQQNNRSTGYSGGYSANNGSNSYQNSYYQNPYDSYETV